MPKNQDELIGTTAAAKELDVTPRQVLNFINGGILPAQRIGRDFLIRRADLALVPKDRKPGPKPGAAKAGKR